MRLFNSSNVELFVYHAGTIASMSTSTPAVSTESPDLAGTSTSITMNVSYSFYLNKMKLIICSCFLFKKKK